jgi:alkylated DNA nucleotide flippase Atl1
MPTPLIIRPATSADGPDLRHVGHVLQHLDPATDIPWHRVVNAKGEVSYTLSRNGSVTFQQRLLEREGTEFDDRNRFNLERFRWPNRNGGIGLPPADPYRATHRLLNHRSLPKANRHVTT